MIFHIKIIPANKIDDRIYKILKLWGYSPPKVQVADGGANSLRIDTWSKKWDFYILREDSSERKFLVNIYPEEFLSILEEVLDNYLWVKGNNKALENYRQNLSPFKLELLLEIEKSN